MLLNTSMSLEDYKNLNKALLCLLRMLIKHFAFIRQFRCWDS